MSHKIIPPYDNENFELHWNYVNFQGKTILDLGADHGSTASFFFEKGARKVIAVEGNPDLYHELVVNYGNDPDVVCIFLFLDKPLQFEDLIKKSKPDIVKIDIEGDELHFLGISREVLLMVPAYMIEVHSGTLKDLTVNKLAEAGYDVSVEYSRPRTEVIIGKKQI